MQPTYTSDEERTARIILQHTDKDSLTVLTRESAQLLQPLVHLPTNILSKIWDIVDQDETGFLTSDQIPRFVRLIGYAQTNEALTRTLLQKPGPECRIDGWTHPKDKEWVQHSNEEELELLVAIMRENDKDNYGMLDATTAKAVLGRSGLPNKILGEIWDLVDDPPKGFLVIHDMRKALRLISCAQRGMKLHRRLYEHPCPLPDLDDSLVEPEVTAPPPLPPRTPIPPTLPTLQTPQISSNVPSSVASNGLLHFPKRPANDPLPAVTDAERKAFIGIFNRSNPINGVITGKQAIDIFSKSRLPTETLSQIWELSDSDHTGTLTRPKFIVAMYLIKGLMDKRLAQLPQIIPPWLILEASKDNDGKLALQQPLPNSVFPPHNGLLGPAPVYPFRPSFAQGINQYSSQMALPQAQGHMRSQSQPLLNPLPDLLDLENEILPPVPPKAASAEQLSSPIAPRNSGTNSMAIPSSDGNTSSSGYLNAISPVVSRRQSDEALPPYTEMAPTMRVQ